MAKLKKQGLVRFMRPPLCSLGFDFVRDVIAANGSHGHDDRIDDGDQDHGGGDFGREHGGEDHEDRRHDERPQPGGEGFNTGQLLGELHEEHGGDGGAAVGGKLLPGEKRFRDHFNSPFWYRCVMDSFRMFRSPFPASRSW